MKLKSLTIKLNHEHTSHPEHKWQAVIAINSGCNHAAGGRGYGSSPSAAAYQALEIAMQLATADIREQIDKQLEVNFVP